METKNKHRFNLIDAFVIFIVLALISATVYYVIRENKNPNAEIRSRNITYTVRLEGVDKKFIENFAEDDHVLNASTMEYIGTISKIRKEKGGNFTDKAANNALGNGFILIKEPREDIYDVYLTITSKTVLDERGVAYIDRQRITIGTTLYLRFGDFSKEASITNFSIS